MHQGRGPVWCGGFDRWDRSSAEEGLADRPIPPRHRDWRHGGNDPAPHHRAGTGRPLPYPKGHPTRLQPAKRLTWRPLGPWLSNPARNDPVTPALFGLTLTSGLRYFVALSTHHGR